MPGFFDDRFFRPFLDLGDCVGVSAFRVDVRDKKDRFELEAELPGVAEDQIEITVEGGMLTISANMNEEKKEESDDFIYKERRVGGFRRSFNVENVKEDEITATYKHGLLCVTLPKKNETQEPAKRKIDIN